ncbi:ABC transporter permease [Pseudofulvibacter geojedonensis]|uniref:ABC transporter permease n=1 Tax=Pseudofulvibacter geojedonensis TaxID=1123758 RepID=A0ABW3I207_9FLAO
MLRLLQIEFQKLWQNRLSKILIIGYFVLLTSIALIAAIKFDIGPIKFHLAEQGIFNFPYIWHFNTFIASFFKLFLAIIIVSMVANEYSNKTIKQNLIDGLSKKEFISSKFITVLLFSAVSTIFVFVTSLILGLIYSNYTEVSIIFSELEYVLAYLTKHIGFFSFCLFIGILIKRSAFALGFLIIWNVIEWISYGILFWVFGRKSSTPDAIAQFFPFRSMSNLIDEPFSRLSAVKAVANQVGEQFNFDYTVHWYELSIVVIWTVLFIWWSYVLLKKRDL